MKDSAKLFNEEALLSQLKHYLPAQSPLKDFIHHNTLHAFQGKKFHRAIREASQILGYKVSLRIDMFRTLFHNGKISDQILERTLAEAKPGNSIADWKEKMLHRSYDSHMPPRIGSLRAAWKRDYRIDLDSMVHPNLFRILCSYLDQGISIWNFPIKDKPFLDALRELEREGFSSFFRTKRAKKILLASPCTLCDLLKIVVGQDESLYAQYLFDQQFAHQGWSGMVSVVEDTPMALLDTRKITLRDLITFELLLEIDALDYQFGEGWEPLETRMSHRPEALFSDIQFTELHEVLSLWQIAFEWTYYDQVLKGIGDQKVADERTNCKSFQAFFCIDDRECSMRRYIESLEPSCETFGTPGFFGMEFFFQPEGGKFYTKLCPAPVTPSHLVKEYESKGELEHDIHFTKHSHNFYTGWLISQTLGFWSAFKLFLTILKPSMSPATAASFRHMGHTASLTIENKNSADSERGLQVGFTIEEMANRIEALLKSTGLVKDFAPLVYFIGHGSTSTNNPHFAAYDCGACAGRAGSVNARVAAYAANHPQVRDILVARGVVIPPETQFLGALHDTTRDDITFFDENSLSPKNLSVHINNKEVFQKALDQNAKERARRFVTIDIRQTANKIHEQVRTRSVSLFEPRPELNHATNALCIVGRRSLSKHLFLDRRAFLNSFDYRVDPAGKYLTGILTAAANVCGGINLEYFFSRVDVQKLGAGSKLPHNVMGLFGVANGIDGDLRPGLPRQMTEVHDPIRLLMIVEHLPEVVLSSLQANTDTYQWFSHEWINLVVLNPETHDLFLFKDGSFIKYLPITNELPILINTEELIESSADNLPVCLLRTA